MPRKTTYQELSTKFNQLNLSWNISEADYAAMTGKSKAMFVCKTHNIEWSNSSIHSVYTEKKKCKECRKLGAKHIDTSSLISDLDNIRMIAESRNGKCLSDVYIDSFHPMLFKCKVEEHPVFEKTPSDIRRNVWCNECAHNAPVTDQKVNEQLERANMEFVEGSRRDGDKSKVILRCKTVHRHTTEVIWSNFKQRPYCNKCGLNNQSLASHIPIYQYELNNRFIRKFNELSDIPDSNPAMLYAIKKNALKQKGNKAYGYIWSILAPVNGHLDETKERTTVEADIIEKLNISFE